MKTQLTFAKVLLVSAIAITACKPKKLTETPGVAETKPAVASAECSNTMYTYAAEVKPIIDNNCAKSCHSANNHAGGINLSDHENVKTEAQKTRFMKSLKHEGTYTPMPKKSPKLSDSTLSILNCWIENGCK